MNYEFFQEVTDGTPRPNIDLAELESFRIATHRRRDRRLLHIAAAHLAAALGLLGLRERYGRAKAAVMSDCLPRFIRLAANGNVAAAIFLAKNVLHYRDVVI